MWYLIVLLILAVLPAMVLLYFVLFMDRTDREPIGLVMKVLALGGAATVPAIALEYLLSLVPVSSNVFYRSFIQAALVEEGMKLAVIMVFVWKHKNFREENDGVIYTGITSLGFALVENIMMVVLLGWLTGLLLNPAAGLVSGSFVGIGRALTAMPLHCFTGVIMGYFVGTARVSTTPATQKKRMLSGFMIAVMIHGFYDMLVLSRTLSKILIIPLIILLIMFGVILLKNSRSLSIKRAAAASEIRDHQIFLQKMMIYSNPVNQVWKVVLSRILFGTTLAIWLLVGLSYFFRWKLFSPPLSEIIVGVCAVSFPMILIGMMLELSHKKNRDDFRNMKERKGHLISEDLRHIAAGIKLFPPGHLWRIILSRVLFVLSGLFWLLTVVFMIFVGSTEFSWLTFFLYGCVLSFLPVYIGMLFEISFNRKKKIYNERQRIHEQRPVTPKDLRLSPPGQLWRVIVSRTMFPIVSIMWLLVLIAIISKDISRDLSPVSFALITLAFTVLPIANIIYLELSYKDKKNEYLHRKKQSEADDEDLSDRDYYQKLREQRKDQVF